jgi:hypothetical protein
VIPVRAVWYAGALWFSSSKKSRKAQNLANDPRCVLTTADPTNSAYRVPPRWAFGLRGSEFTGSPTHWIFSD